MIHFLGAGALLLSLFQVPELPDGRGKKTTEQLCGNCHGLAILSGPKRTKAVWRKTVDQMAALGVEGADEEFEEVVEYLTRHFGKINVNTASAAELRDVLDISPKEAKALIRHRETSGEFKDFDGLKKTPGLDAKKIEGRKDRILFR